MAIQFDVETEGESSDVLNVTLELLAEDRIPGCIGLKLNKTIVG